MIPGLSAVLLAAALVVGIVVARRRSSPRMSTTSPLVVHWSPLTVIDRVEQAVAGIDGYTCERHDREIVVFRRHEGPLGFFDRPDAWLSEATMDLLHVTAERRDGQTEVLVRGRSEARVINRVRRAVSRRSGE